MDYLRRASEHRANSAASTANDKDHSTKNQSSEVLEDNENHFVDSQRQSFEGDTQFEWNNTDQTRLKQYQSLPIGGAKVMPHGDFPVLQPACVNIRYQPNHSTNKDDVQLVMSSSQSNTLFAQQSNEKCIQDEEYSHQQSVSSSIKTSLSRVTGNSRRHRRETVESRLAVLRVVQGCQRAQLKASPEDVLDILSPSKEVDPDETIVFCPSPTSPASCSATPASLRRRRPNNHNILTSVAQPQVTIVPVDLDRFARSPPALPLGTTLENRPSLSPLAGDSITTTCGDSGLSLRCVQDESSCSLPLPTGDNDLHRYCRDATKVQEDLQQLDPCLEQLLTTSLAAHHNGAGETPLHVWSNSCSAVSDRRLAVDFGLHLFLTYPAAMLTTDAQQLLPFEGVLRRWVQEQQDKPRNNTAATNPKSGASSSSAPSDRTASLKQLPPMLSFDSKQHISVGSTAVKSSRLELNAEVVLAMESVSVILDYLEEQQQRQPLKTSKSSPDDSDSLVELCLHFTTVQDLHREICQTMASIPNLMSAIWLFPNEQERKHCLSLTLIRRILVHDRSIGSWLTQMIKQEPEAALEYLQLVSTTLDASSRTDTNKHSRRTRTNLAVHEGQSFSDIDKNDLMCIAISRLSDFVPSLLSLGDTSIIEEAATTHLVGRVLDRLTARPFAVLLILLDAVFLATLLIGYRGAVRQLLTSKDTFRILRYIYLANTGIFYFVIRELRTVVCLWTNRGPVGNEDDPSKQKEQQLWNPTHLQTKGQQTLRWHWSVWNVIDCCSVLLALWSTIRMRQQQDLYMTSNDVVGDQSLRTLLAITTGFLWLRVLSFLKGINRQLATFVLAILQITKDVFWFCVILLTMVFSFAQMFFTLMVPKTCADEVEHMERNCNQAEYYLKVYTILLGDFGLFKREQFDSRTAVILAVLYTFMVVLILLNVLIAVASDSYEKCLLRSQNLFGRARVMMVAEVVCFQDLIAFRSTGEHQSQQQEPWTSASFVFLALSSCVVGLWVMGEVVGYFRGHANIPMSSVSIVVNLFVFSMLRSLTKDGAVTRSHDGSDDDSSTMSPRNQSQSQQQRYEWLWNIIQRGVLRLLGSAGDYSSHHEDDVWHGRLDYLNKAIQKSSDRALTKYEPLLDRLQEHQRDNKAVEDLVKSLKQTMDRLEALEQNKQEGKS